jgi:hypothetical protein
MLTIPDLAEGEAHFPYPARLGKPSVSHELDKELLRHHDVKEHKQEWDHFNNDGSVLIEAISYRTS